MFKCNNISYLNKQKIQVHNRHVRLAQRLCELLICVSGIILSPSRGRGFDSRQGSIHNFVFLSGIFLKELMMLTAVKKSYKTCTNILSVELKSRLKHLLMFNECRVLSSDANLNDQTCVYVLIKHTNSCIYSTTFKVCMFIKHPLKYDLPCR